jgi:predicted O-methyltransferase YrrM
MVNLKKLHDEARKQNIPIMKDDGMAYLLSFLKEHTEIRDILECGTAVGYSAIRMAEIRWDMRVDTLEVDETRYQEAVRNIHEAGLDDRVHCYLYDAAEYETEKRYDLIFVDAAKSQYRRYLEYYYPYLLQGGYMIFDNLAFHGIVDDESRSHNRSTIQMVHKIRKFRESLLEDERFEVRYEPERGDGIAIARKK